MPTEVVCSKGHVTGKKLGAFRAFAATDGNARCWCGARQRILVTERYPTDPDTTYEYEVIKIARLYNDQDAEDDGYDKMLVMSRRKGTKDGVIIKPMYWAKNERGNWGYGQYAAALEPEEWRTLFRKLGLLWAK